jgi:dTDP-4-amino-4,6-dideoxygalactose transaminase
MTNAAIRSADWSDHRSSGAVVPFLDLKAVNQRFRDDIAREIAGVLDSGRYLQGDANLRFAAQYAKWGDFGHCVPMANGLDALRLTLRAWITLGRLRPGDEVVVPANSFIASALAVTDSGLRLRFADVHPETHCLTRETVARSLTDATRVVMPVHLYGLIDGIHEIRELCRGSSILVIEDAAQAHGARLAGRHAGSFGDAGAFSFYPSKNLGALGDAGCMVTGDPDLAERVRSLGNYGSTRKYHHDHCGVNSRMDELQAVALAVKLRHLDADNARRREIASSYDERILHPAVRKPRHPADALAHVWHLYVVRVAHRESLATHLKSRGIETMVHYPTAIHRQPAYRDAYRSVTLPVSEQLQEEVLSLPISPVMTAEQVDRVVCAVNEWHAPQSVRA